MYYQTTFKEKEEKKILKVNNLKIYFFLLQDNLFLKILYIQNNKEEQKLSSWFSTERNYSLSRALQSPRFRIKGGTLGVTQ